MPNKESRSHLHILKYEHLKYEVEAGPDWIPSHSRSGPESGLWEGLHYTIGTTLSGILIQGFDWFPLW